MPNYNNKTGFWQNLKLENINGIKILVIIK
jgi:hypothetical protein